MSFHYVYALEEHNWVGGDSTLLSTTSLDAAQGVFVGNFTNT